MNIQTKNVDMFTSVTQLRDIFDAQTSAYAANKYPEINERIEQLTRLKAIVLKNQQALVQAISDDFGHRCHDET